VDRHSRLGGASGTAFVAKAELATAPMVGWLARINRTVFVTREDRMGVADQVNRLKEALADNWSITVFPKARRPTASRCCRSRPRCCACSNRRLPVCSCNRSCSTTVGTSANGSAGSGTEAGVDNAKRILARRGSFKLEVFFLEPFDPRDHAGRKAIAAEARRRILPALEARLAIRFAPLPIPWRRSAACRPNRRPDPATALLF
jgi:1-acyl-sn-glycerol-3-phosphate acyltransferase